MKKFTLFTFLLIFTAGFAQSDVIAITNETGDGTGMWVVQKGLDQKIKGSYYLFDGHMHTGVITVGGGKKYQVSNLNYNIKDDRLESRITADSVYIFDSRNIVQVDFGDVKFRTLMNPEKYGLSFFEVIGSFNKKSLLKLHTLKIVEGMINPMSHQKQTPDKFVKDTEYYVRDSSGEMEEFKLKKKTVLRFFNNISDEVDQYASEHDLSFKDDEDLIRIFKKYATI
jgi:hypothetical protein